MRLIDADMMHEMINWTLWKPPFSRKQVRQIVDNCPTIDAVDVIKCEDCKRWGKEFGFRIPCLDEIDDMPTIEAEPVKRGKWTYKEYGGIGYFVCSKCGQASWNAEGNHYCFNCGAKMDLGEVKDNETD